MADLAVLDMAASLGDLEPAYVVDRRGGAGDGAFDRILDAVGELPTISITL